MPTESSVAFRASPLRDTETAFCVLAHARAVQYITRWMFITLKLPEQTGIYDYAANVSMSLKDGQ